MLNYFKKFSSNTIGAGANQTFFCPQNDEVRTGLAFFRISAGGRYCYSLLFSDIIDSTFADGSVSVANMRCGGYTIHSLKVGRCSATLGETVDELKSLCVDDLPITHLVSLKFGGEESKTIGEGECCFTDPADLYFDKGEYIAVLICYSGKRIPCHSESMLPLYNKTKSGWEYSVDMPLPLMIGCDRRVKGRIGYLGDSITQGIGAGYNTYKHWCARIADMIGTEYSHYNLGIGYSRAADAAADGAWLQRAKTCDSVFVCLGTNDVAHDNSGAEHIARYVETVIDKLREVGCRVILQTAPPFDREGERREKWFALNKIIKEELSKKVDALFDNIPCLRLSEEFPERAKYGGHPNAAGCEIWADALYERIKDLF